MNLKTKYSIGDTAWVIDKDDDYATIEVRVVGFSYNSPFEYSEESKSPIVYICMTLEQEDYHNQFPEMSVWYKTFDEGHMFDNPQDAEENLFLEMYGEQEDYEYDIESGTTEYYESGFTEDYITSGDII